MRLFRSLLLRGWLPAALIALWWFASAESESVYFPPLEQILTTFVDDWLGEHFVRDLLPSLGKLFAGFAIASILGVVFGLVLGLNRRLRVMFDPIIMFFRSVPGPVLVPIGILLLGIGPTMHIFIIVAGAIWPVLLGTIDGVRSLDPTRTEFMKSYRLSLAQRIRYVILPNAGPQAFAGMRTGLQLSVVLIVVAEMVGANRGIGYYVITAQQTFATSETWAGTILLGIVGFSAAQIFSVAERRALWWQRGLLRANV